MFSLTHTTCADCLNDQLVLVVPLSMSRSRHADVSSQSHLEQIVERLDLVSASDLDVSLSAKNVLTFRSRASRFRRDVR